jgi:hypothetical protein
LLKDIGLTYTQAEHEANKPFWRPWRAHASRTCATSIRPASVGMISPRQMARVMLDRSTPMRRA